MTDGTSQGLFVVVAIVIFGIFVALSYTVFGSDGLSGGIKGLFDDSLSRVENLHGGYVDIDFELYTWDEIEGSFEVHSLTEDSLEYTHDGIFRHGKGGLIHSSYLEFDAQYKVSYDITKISGEVHTIGGHHHVSETADVFINGVKQENGWNRANPFINDNETHSVEVYFDSDYLEVVDGVNMGTNGSSRDYYSADFHIATNRGVERFFNEDDRESHRVIIENVRVQKLVPRR